MKVTKRQLKRIIKEEKQKLVNEMRGMDVQRFEGLHFDTKLSDEFVRTAADLITNAMESAQEDGLEGYEARELVLAVIQQLVRDADNRARY